MDNSRRNFLQYSSLGIASLLVSPWAHGASTFNRFSTGGFETIRGNVGYFTGRGGTIGWLVNKEAIAVVDSQFPPSAQELIDEIRKKTDRKFDYLINTHHHGDHTSGNIAFKGMVDHVFAHENSKGNQMRVAQERGKEDGQLYPTLTFKNEWSTELGDEVVSCSYHGQAHTNGDIFTHFENANVVHMGDLMFNRRFPYIDKSAGAHIGNWINVLDKATTKFDDETIFIFGHAGEGYEITGTKEDIKAFKNYLESLMKFMEAEVKAGKSAEEIKEATKIIPGAPEWKGDGIARSIDSAFSEITTGK